MDSRQKHAGMTYSRHLANGYELPRASARGAICALLPHRAFKPERLHTCGLKFTIKF